MTSAGTQDQDTGFKKTLYEQLEVQEYWLFDPGASHFCRNNLLWGGHPARPLALTGFPACPTRKCICTIGMLP